MAKHSWILDASGAPDIWQVEYDHHNGPRCAACGEGYCEHCDDIDALDDCDATIVIYEGMHETREINA